MKSSWSSCRYFLFLLWTVFIMISCVFLFTGGFLLRRQVLELRSEPQNSTLAKKEVFSKAIVIIIDALKHDFTLYEPSLEPQEQLPYQNKLPVLYRLQQEQGAGLFRFLADPPTTTMQRLKGLTTGSLPTFIDVSSNFGSYEITEDNLIDQFVSNGAKRVVFAGDDTWLGLFPNQFTRANPYPSFDVWDLDTVDRGVNESLARELGRSSDWDIFIGHYLGVDHAGHKFGPLHTEMSRKLEEANSVVEHIVEKMPEDCLLVVLGDHGMTLSGDHGGDSFDEVNAALFAYSKKHSFRSEHPVDVEQVDLVPTLAALLGVPIPFSSLGKLIMPLIPGSEKDKLSFLNLNVMHYLEMYSLSPGGSLPRDAFWKLREDHQSYVQKQKGALSEDDLSELIQLGLKLLTEAKDMCSSVWINFDLRLMAAGTTLLLLQVSLLLLLLFTPKNRLLTGIVSTTFISYLWLTLVAGLALGSVLLSLNVIKKKDKTEYSLSIFALAMSILLFGFNLLWKLKESFIPILRQMAFGVTNFRSYTQVILLLLSFSALFSNSFVVDEASVVHFLTVTAVVLHMGCAFRGQVKLSYTLIPLCLILIGILRLTNIYFRCREEQMAYCAITDFHKPIGTLPKDGDPSYKMYRQWRFFSTIAGVCLLVLLPHLWLRKGGNFNGHSLPVSLAVYLPTFIGFSMICYWALQNHPGGANLLPWQHNFLAQLAFGLSFTLLLVCLYQPLLLYKDTTGSEVIVNVNRGMQGYFDYIRSQWKQQLSMKKASSPDKIHIFGLGNGLSAPYLVMLCSLGLASMLVMGDGLCFSVFLAFCVMALFLYISSINRVARLDSQLRDIFSSSWSVAFTWWLFECLFFYATGHQATFTTLQWSAAFVGVSGANFGGNAKDATSVLNVALPATLIGWNTFVSRILFGLALPMVFLSPFAFWMHSSTLRMAKAPESSEVKKDVSNGNAVNHLLQIDSLALKDFEQGEVVLLNHPEEVRSQLFLLSLRYLLLHGLRLFGAMLAAAVLRRHLMVWKIFAPRFLFEALGFIISCGSILVGYGISVRVLNVLFSYYIKEKQKSE